MEYKIPATNARIENVIFGSRFIANAMRVETVTAVRERLNVLRNEMSDANHHAYAFRIGYGNSVIEGKSDDGEPKGTAGAPVLAMIRGSDIGDIMVVVTRYFGGRKLGTGGLARAYGGAAREVIEKLSIEKRIERTRLTIFIPYPLLDRVRHKIMEFDFQEIDCTYRTEVQLEVSIAEKDRIRFENTITELSAATVNIRVNG